MSDRGHAAVELALGVVVLLVPVILVVSSFGPWSERRVLVRSLAAEAARTAVVELDLAAGAEVVERAVEARGVERSEVRLGWCGAEPGPLARPAGSCALTRGSLVEATVLVWVPMVVTPWGEVGGIWAAASHREPVDLYRSLG